MAVENKFGIGIVSDKVVMMFPPTRTLSSDEATELAVWLLVMAACADPDRPREVVTSQFLQLVNEAFES